MFDIHMQIARNLQLKDCLAYSTVSQICVLHIFTYTHRIELDWGSLIVNNRLSIQSDLFLQILHAHTRVRTIRNLMTLHPFQIYQRILNSTGITHILSNRPDFGGTVPIFGAKILDVPLFLLIK